MQVLKIALLIAVFVTCYFILDSIIQIENSFSFSFKSNNFTNYTNIPPVFQRNDLWRPQYNQIEDINSLEDRYAFQKEWVSRVSRSMGNYMGSVKKKKRILLTGNFNLDDRERGLPCYEEGVNFSHYCELVEDVIRYPFYHNYDEFDAVLARRDWEYQFYEPKIPPRLLTFFHIQESPYTLEQGDFRVNNPILASYWRGSDIIAPYYRWVPFNDVGKKKPLQRNYAENKTRLATIAVSHCPTANDRLGYVHELQKYIPVDIYGDCGPLGKHADFKQYKFYLAFENSNCRDYITEKLFINALGGEMIPVVMGAHPEDYRYAAPPHSFIHIEDFHSPKELAAYLLKLDQDDALYNEYFEWKGSGEIIPGHEDLFCRVCAFIYYSEFHSPPPHWPTESFSWLKVNPCLKPGERYWGTFKHY